MTRNGQGAARLWGGIFTAVPIALVLAQPALAASVGVEGYGGQGGPVQVDVGAPPPAAPPPAEVLPGAPAGEEVVPGEAPITPAEDLGGPAGEETESREAPTTPAAERPSGELPFTGLELTLLGLAGGGLVLLGWGARRLSSRSASR